MNHEIRWNQERCTCRGAEGFVAHGTQKAVVLPRVDANVALASLSSGRASHIRAKCCCGVHAGLLRVTLGNVPTGVCLDSHLQCKRTIHRLPGARRVARWDCSHPAPSELLVKVSLQAAQASPKARCRTR